MRMTFCTAARITSMIAALVRTTAQSHAAPECAFPLEHEVQDGPTASSLHPAARLQCRLARRMGRFPAHGREDVEPESGRRARDLPRWKAGGRAGHTL